MSRIIPRKKKRKRKERKEKERKWQKLLSNKRSLAIWFISFQLKFQISFPALIHVKDKGQHILTLSKALTTDINP